MTPHKIEMQRYNVVSEFMNNQTNTAWDKMVREVNKLGLSDGEPDPDLLYTWHCPECS